MKEENTTSGAPRANSRARAHAAGSHEERDRVARAAKRAAALLGMTRTMVVSELIEQLQRCHPEASVSIVTKILPESSFPEVHEICAVISNGSSVGIFTWEAASQAIAAKHLAGG